MKIIRIGLQTAVVAALLTSGLALASCRDGRPGYDSDRHGGRHGHGSGHDRDHSHGN